MKISQDYPQFTTPTFILVTGKQDGYIYRAANGEIEQVDHVKEETPEYSDNEGFFQRSGHGQTFDTGNVREDRQGVEHHVMKEFLAKYQEAVHDAVAGEDSFEVIIFTPDYMKDMLKEKLEASVQKAVIQELHGNFTHTSVDDLLKKIAEKREGERVVPESEEAHKILHKTDR